MEQKKERKFVCKFCSKRFPCGKSLGGHIRVHMNENSAESEEESADKLILSNSNGKNINTDSGLEAGAQSGYGLRENPKKTKRFVDQTEIASQDQLICRECGKGFNSLKALCGHMACHSDREKMVMDSQSDTETSSAPIRRRSKRMKRKAVVVGDQCNTLSYAIGNSSSVSEIEQEQEELAMCLMMLSKDSSFKKGNHNFSTFAESSDNNSVILEAKSSSADVRTNFKTGLKCAPNADEIFGMKNQRENSKLHFSDNNVLLSYSDNSDSGYFRTRLESDVSVDGFLKNPGFNKDRLEFGSGSDDPIAKPEKIFSKVKPGAAEVGKGLLNDGEDRGSKKYDLRKSKRLGPYCPGSSSINPPRKIKNGLKTNACSEAAHESGENSLETGSCADPNQLVAGGSSKIESCTSKNMSVYKKLISKKKSKGHECPICFRVFKSGQALGGHKRSHFIGNQEESTVVINEELTNSRGLIDLNLPAPIDE